MTSDVVLSAALRSNLLSLQNTQKSIDKTQLQLSTGKKVNSALDNPQSYFASQALTNRASDLSKLLDSIGQSIQVIKAADTGVTALTNLINQAQAIAQTAQSTVSSSSQQASVTTNVDLSNVDNLASLAGVGAGATLTFRIIDPATGKALTTLDTYGAGSTGSSEALTIPANTSSSDLVNNINNLVDTRDNSHVLSASLDSSGHINITSLNGGAFNVKFTTTANTDAANQALAQALGFGNLAKTVINGTTATPVDTVEFTASGSNNISSTGLYTSTNTLALGTTLLKDVKDSSGTALTTLAAADTLKITVGGKTSNDLLHYTNGTFSGTATTTSVQNLIDAINNDSNISSLVSANFDTTTGKIQLTAKDAAATDVSVAFASAVASDKFSLGFGISTLTTSGVNSTASEDIRFGAAAGQLASLQTQYNTVRSQIDALVTNGDTGYAGTNLLNGQDLVTYFNEGRTSSLTTTGSTFTASGLGIKEANFQSSSSVNDAITQTNDALSTIRDFGSSLATNLSVIQTRQDFTNNLINTLTDGAAALTNVDQNAAGATLLALQTRQSLGVTALSLASQSQQSILRLF